MIKITNRIDKSKQTRLDTGNTQQSKSKAICPLFHTEGSTMLKRAYRGKKAG